MNLLRIAAKEIRQGSRNPFANAIVGSALDGMGGGAAPGKINVSYRVEEGARAGERLPAFPVGDRRPRRHVH